MKMILNFINYLTDISVKEKIIVLMMLAHGNMIDNKYKLQIIGNNK